MVEAKTELVIEDVNADTDSYEQLEYSHKISYMPMQCCSNIKKYIFQLEDFSDGLRILKMHFAIVNVKELGMSTARRWQ